jgi:hypothetical protein
MIVLEWKTTAHRSAKKDIIQKPLEPAEATIEEEEESASTSDASFRAAIP